MSETNDSSSVVQVFDDGLDIPVSLRRSLPPPRAGVEAIAPPTIDELARTSHPLTKELFEANGVPVAEQSELVCNQLTPQAGRALQIRLGTEAMQRLNDGGRDWTDWCRVLDALGIGRHVAMLESGSNEPRGYKYSQAFSKWLRCHEVFETIDKADRKRLFDCLDNLPAIEDWRAGLPAAQRFRWNYPPTVLREWKKSKRPSSEQERSGKESQETFPADLTPQQLRAQIEKLGWPRFKQEVLPPDWVASLTTTAIAQAKSEQHIASLECKISPTNKAARKHLRELKKAIDQPPTIPGKYFVHR